VTWIRNRYRIIELMIVVAIAVSMDWEAILRAQESLRDLVDAGSLREVPQGPISPNFPCGARSDRPWEDIER